MQTSENLDATSRENEPLIKEKKKQENIQISLEAVDKIDKNLYNSKFESKNGILPDSKYFFEKIKNFLGLDLLSNLTYLNIMIGLSLFYVADTNFKLFTPFLLSSIGEF